jgi:hypothetical protein
MMSSASTVIDRLLAAMNALDVDGFVLRVQRDDRRR